MTTHTPEKEPYDELKHNPLFENVDAIAFQQLVQHLKTKSITKSTFCIEDEKIRRHFYFILKGKVKVFNLNASDKQCTLFILSTTDVFDVFTLVNNQNHKVCYEVLENLEVLEISMEIFRNWLKNNSQVLNCFFKYSIEKYQMLEMLLLDISTNSLSVRIANLLLNYYNPKNHQIEGICNLSHDELSQLVGTSRAVFNRHIQKLKNENIIQVTRKRITILNLALLQAQSNKLG